MKVSEFNKLSGEEIEAYILSRGVTCTKDLLQHVNYQIRHADSVATVLDLEHSRPNDIYIYEVDNTKTNGCVEIAVTVEISTNPEILATLEIYVRNTKKSIRVSGLRLKSYRSTSDRVTIFEKIHGIFDSRPTYNNLEIDYTLEDIDHKIPMTTYYEQIVSYRKELDPFIEKVIEEYDNGNYEKNYIRYTGKPFTRGNAILCDSFSAFVNFLYKNGIDKTEEYVCLFQFIMNRLPKYKEFKDQNGLNYETGMTTDEYVDSIKDKFDMIKAFMVGGAEYTERLIQAKKKMEELFLKTRTEICKEFDVKEKDFIVGLNVIM